MEDDNEQKTKEEKGLLDGGKNNDEETVDKKVEEKNVEKKPTEEDKNVEVNKPVEDEKKVEEDKNVVENKPLIGEGKDVVKDQKVEEDKKVEEVKVHDKIVEEKKTVFDKKWMQAITIVEWGKLELREVPIPTVSKNLVLVKVMFSAINPSDLSSITGHYPSGIIPPGTAGSEGSGEIVAVGEDLIFPHQVGDRVSFVTRGAWAEYVFVPAFMATTIDKENSYQEATCHFVNPGTVYSFLDLAKKTKKTAIIHSAGASALGKMLIKACKAEGIKSINLVRNKKYFDELTKLGSDCNLDMSDKDFVTDLIKVAKDFNATIFFDAVAGDLTHIVANAMPDHSTTYVYGSLSGQNVKEVSVGDLIFRKQSIHGFWLVDYCKSYTPHELIEMGQIIQKNLKTTYKTETKVFEFSDYLKALEHSKSNASESKSLLKFN